jgi:hypothetical protein
MAKGPARREEYTVMMDWIVLLVPLAALPIALLFVFVGCALDTSGTPLPTVALLIGAGFETDIDTVKVTFQYSLSSGESPSNLTAIQTLSGSDLDEGTLIDKSSDLNLVDQPEGKLSCTCLITRKTLEQVTISSAQSYSGDPESRDLTPFELFREGANFKLEVPEIEFTGGGL